MYLIEIESTSIYQACFLDLLIFKQKNNLSPTSWSLSHRPFTKPTARHLPLSSLSVHPDSIHRSWTTNEIRRLWKNSAKNEDFDKAKSKMCSRWAECFLDPGIVRTCRQWHPPLTSCERRAGERQERTTDTQPQILHLVLPFHPELRVGLQGAFSKVCERFGECMYRLAGKRLEIRVVWAKAGKSLLNIVKRISRQKG